MLRVLEEELRTALPLLRLVEELLPRTEEALEARLALPFTVVPVIRPRLAEEVAEEALVEELVEVRRPSMRAVEALLTRRVELVATRSPVERRADEVVILLARLRRFALREMAVA